MHYAQTQLTMAFSPILGLAGVPPPPSQNIDSVYQTHLQGEHQNFLLLGKLFRMMCDHTCPHLLRCDQICEHIIM